MLILVGFGTEALCIALLGGIAARRRAAGAARPAAPATGRPALGRGHRGRPLAGRRGGGRVPPDRTWRPAGALGSRCGSCWRCSPGAVWPLPYGLVGLAAPAVVLDERGPLRALVRSVRLASRDGMRAAWIRVLGYLGWLADPARARPRRRSRVDGIRFTSPSTTVDTPAPGRRPLVVNAIAYPMLGCLDVALHLEARMRTEGLDIRCAAPCAAGVTTAHRAGVPRPRRPVTAMTRLERGSWRPRQ